eukprot:gene8711-1096_t
MSTTTFSHQPPARVGRHHQRYATDGVRLVAGCVPYRDLPDKSVEVLLISNRKKNMWIIPKGGWEKDESEQQAAAREAYEEAGVEGKLGECLCNYEFEGKSGRQLHRYFALKVDKEFDDWPESNDRTRKWVTIDKALEHCKRQGMHEAICALTGLIQQQDTTALSTSATALVDSQNPENLHTLQ